MAGLAGAPEIIGAAETPRAFDAYCPLSGLPAAFGTKFDSISPAVPYLRPPLNSSLIWEMRLGAKEKPRIGLVWESDPEPDGAGVGGATALSALLRLTEFDATFVSLQKDLHPDAEEVLKAKGISRLGEGLADFSDMAALLACFDLVIAVDSSIAHLAGALGKPVWILLPYTPDWRWLLGHRHTPWYPTARLFRQSRTGEWDDVIAQVASELPGVLSRGRTVPTRTPP